MTNQELLIALGQWLSVVVPTVGGMRYSVGWLYKKFSPLFELPGAVANLSNRVEKLEEEIKKASAIESRLQEIGLGINELRNAIQKNSIRLDVIEAVF